MKINITEYDDMFWIDLTPETMGDQVQLLRLKMNAKKKQKFNLDVFCYGQHPVKKEMIGFLTLSKKKDYSSHIKFKGD